MTTRTELTLRRLGALADRPSRLVDYLREPRDFVVGGPTANRLGLQIARTVIDHALWTVRRTMVPESIRDAYETIERDGIVVIPNFLPEEQLNAVLAEVENSRRAHASRYKTEPFGENLLSEQLLVTDWPDDYPTLCAALRDNAFLLSLASAVARRPMTFRPHMHVQVIHKPDASAPHEDHNEAQFLHTDRHYPFVKAFFYLDDVDEQSAPYTFVPGSHVINWQRLKYEYELSIRVSRNRRQFDQRDRRADQAELHRYVYEIATKLMAANGWREKPIVGRRNTLIVSNNQGLHRRGDFISGRSRLSVNLDYKYLESPAHKLYPVLKRLPPRLTGI
jgi:hypothetical protein